MPIQFITPSIISSVANTQVTGTITVSQLATSLNLATNNVQVASIQSATGTPGITFAANGQVTLANTPLQLTGGQIVFPATQIASGDANTLDDYEEGSWTPTFEGGTTNPTLTYAAQVARYTKIGNVVTVNGRVRVNAISSAGSGTLYIAGLPFATASISNLQNAGCIGTAFFWSTTTHGAPDGISADDTATKMILRVYKNDAGKVATWSSAEAGDLANDCGVDFQMTYRIS